MAQPSPFLYSRLSVPVCSGGRAHNPRWPGAPARGAFQGCSPTPAAMGVVSENPHSGMPPARPQDAPAALGAARRFLSPAPLASEFGRHRQNCDKKSETVAKTQIFPLLRPLKLW